MFVTAHHKQFPLKNVFEQVNSQRPDGSTGIPIWGSIYRTLLYNLNWKLKNVYKL